MNIELTNYQDSNVYTKFGESCKTPGAGDTEGPRFEKGRSCSWRSAVCYTLMVVLALAVLAVGFWGFWTLLTQLGEVKREVRHLRGGQDTQVRHLCGNYSHLCYPQHVPF